MTAPICGDKLLYQHLTTAGDGTGTFEAIEDYSGGGLGATDFFIEPGANEIFAIETITIAIEDNAKISADKYGGITALTEGIAITIENDSGVVLDITTNAKIKTNTGWASYFDSMNTHTFGTGNELVIVYWKVSDTGRSILLDGNANEKLIFELNDDFSSLVSHTFFAHGAKGTKAQNNPGFHV